MNLHSKAGMLILFVNICINICLSTDINIGVILSIFEHVNMGVKIGSNIFIHVCKRMHQYMSNHLG